MADKEINTSGGTVVEKDVNVNNGDFIGRDSVQTKTNIFDGSAIVAVIAILVVGIIGVFTIVKDKSTSVRFIEQPVSTDTASAFFQSYDVGEDFKQNCINTGHWSPYSYLSTSQTIGREVSGFIPVSFKLGCMEPDAQKAWGFYGRSGSLTIHNTQELESTLYGLSTPLPENSTIELNLLVQNSSTGEIYFGILSKSRADPLSEGETFVSAHPNSVIQLATTSLGTLDSYPFAVNRVYKLKFVVTSEKLQVNINSGEKIFEANGNFSSHYFMIGYRLQSGEVIDATISNLSISVIRNVNAPPALTSVNHEGYLSILDSYALSRATNRIISGNTSRKPISCLSKMRIANLTETPTMIISFDMRIRYDNENFEIKNISWHPYANSVGIRNNLSFDPLTVSTALYSDSLYWSGQSINPGTVTDFPYKIDKTSAVDLYATSDFSYDTSLNSISQESKEGFLPLQISYSLKTAHNQILETDYDTCIYIR